MPFDEISNSAKYFTEFNRIFFGGIERNKKKNSMSKRKSRHLTELNHVKPFDAIERICLRRN